MRYVITGIKEVEGKKNEAIEVFSHEIDIPLNVGDFITGALCSLDHLSRVVEKIEIRAEICSRSYDADLDTLTMVIILEDKDIPNKFWDNDGSFAGRLI